MQIGKSKIYEGYMVGDMYIYSRRIKWKSC